MKKLRVCVIGAGALGTVHARTWSKVPEVEIVAVADPLTDRAEKLGQEVGAPWFADYHEALRVPGIHAVSVAVPTCYHRECSEAAMDEGFHVICEKPVAMTLDDARSMLAKSQERGVKLALGFCKRFMGQVEKATELVQAGRIGRPVQYRHVSGWEIRPKPWIMDRNMGGGPLVDIACHYVDQWRVIFGSDPARVKASGLLFSKGAPELPGMDPQIDTFNLIVEYASGDIGSLLMTWGLPRGVAADSLEDCLGPRGVLKIKGNNITLVGPGGSEETFENLRADMFERELNAFAEAIRENKPVAAGVPEGIAALHVSLAALQSIECGEAVYLGSLE